MRSKIAFILAVVLIFSTISTAYAMNEPLGGGYSEQYNTVTGNDTAPDSNDIQAADTGTVSDSDNITDKDLERRVQTDIGAVGQVDVSIGTALILNRPVEFAVKLTDSRNESMTDTITLGGNAVEESKVSFEKLADGDYTLTVSARGFAAYSQNISVEGRAYDISLTTGFLGGINYTAGSAHPGVLLIGDVNGDGKVDITDSKRIVDAIDSAVRGRSFDNASEDLNGDGEINLVDLEYFAKGYNVTGDTQASAERFVPVVMISPAASGGTRVDGDLTALLKDRASVCLSPAAGVISTENPVALEFDFAEGDAAMADGILIETKGDDSISDAVISIEYITY
ncbi:MAG: dockerin type I repeat-containing protein, partial [Acetatifactor sp.]|nr:dockerin type I repeat-containing protein [Acetatifactor sp.]